MNTSRQNGFTLIEIMIVLAILAIITAIAIPLYQGYMAEARIGTSIKDIRQAELILNDLAMDASLNAVEPVGYTGGSALNVYQDSRGVVVAAAPPAGARAWLDPWGNGYQYERPPVLTVGGVVSNNSTNPQGYDLYSRGPDGVAGNADDVVRGCNGAFLGRAGDHPAC